MQFFIVFSSWAFITDLSFPLTPISFVPTSVSKILSFVAAFCIVLPQGRDDAYVASKRTREEKTPTVERPEGTGRYPFSETVVSSDSNDFGSTRHPL